MARPRNDLVERQKVLELLDAEIAIWESEKRTGRRFSTQWRVACGALSSLHSRRKAVASMPGWTASTRGGA